MNDRYLMPTPEAGRHFIMQQLQGSIVMLNLLRLRDVADYTESPALLPCSPISGRAAYQKYINHTLPFLVASGSEVLFIGDACAYLIGPTNEHWDQVLLIRQKSVNSFLAFESNAEYLQGVGHRTAAIQDARLLPIIEIKSN